MSQEDYVIANQTGLQFRTDLNNTLAAIVSNNSGATAPSTTFAYMWWADTSAGILKIRNSANNAWINVGALSGSSVMPVIPLGSNSAPGLYFEGDSNTGLFSGGADLASITVGGTELLRADGVLTYLKFLGTKGVLIPSGTTAQRPTGVEGIFRYNSDNTRFEIYENAAWRDVVNVSETQTLTNKTLTTPVVDIFSMTDQGSTPSTPSSGTTKVYSKTDGKIYKITSAGVEQQIGTGSSGGSINYDTNPDFETATTGYAAYADAAAASPVDGTGGSPSLTITRTTSSPLRDTASGLITKGATNRQGDGISYDFTIASADQAKVMQISFDYAVASGTFAGGTDSAVGDLVLYIYDVTNATIIQPSGYKVLGSVSGQFYKHLATFQTASNSTSYRLIWHVATTSASAWTFKFDNVQVGPQVIGYGAPVTDWVAYTPTTVQGFGTATTFTVQSRRVGDSLEIQGRFNAGTVAASEARISLGYNGVSSNVTIDSTKLATTRVIGTWARNLADASAVSYYALGQPGVTYFNVGVQNASTAPLGLANGNAVADNSGSVSFWLLVPIAGWGSSVVMSNDTESRVVAFQSNGSSTSISTSVSQITWTTTAFDTHGGFNGTNTFTIPVPGYYSIAWNTQTAAVNLSTGQRYLTELYKNGAEIADGSRWIGNGASVIASSSGSIILKLVAGDTISLYGISSVATAISGAAVDSYLSIQRISGPAQIAASDAVGARYNDCGSSLTTSPTKMTFTNKDKDTHSAYASGTYTVPTPGWYDVKAMLLFSQTPAVGDAGVLYIYKNGAAIISNLYRFVVATATVTDISVADTYYFNTGDTVEIYANSGGTSISVSASTTRNIFSIIKRA